MKEFYIKVKSGGRIVWQMLSYTGHGRMEATGNNMRRIYNPDTVELEGVYLYLDDELKATWYM